jgi:hypothetical protein
MQELKLYLVYHMGNSPCWNLRIAHSQEEALMQCFDKPPENRPDDIKERSCRVEEVKFDGYELKIEKT